MLSNNCIETLVLELAASHEGLRTKNAMLLEDYRDTLEELRSQAQQLKDIRERCPEALQAPPTKEQVAEAAFGEDVYKRKQRDDAAEATAQAVSRSSRYATR